MDEMDEIYTVFGVYEDNGQPYATTVEATDPVAAMQAAQEQADRDNGTHEELIGMQVVAGVVEVVA